LAYDNLNSGFLTFKPTIHHLQEKQMAEAPPPLNQVKNEIAVALKYDIENDISPKVVASGKGYIAEQILAIARQSKVAIKEDKELAQILSLLDINSPIPIEAYATVAEILSLLYRTNAQLKQSKK
jgi:flagellar biosynthesis protein